MARSLFLFLFTLPLVSRVTRHRNSSNALKCDLEIVKCNAECQCFRASCHGLDLEIVKSTTGYWYFRQCILSQLSFPMSCEKMSSYDRIFPNLHDVDSSHIDHVFTWSLDSKSCCSCQCSPLPPRRGCCEQCPHNGDRHLFTVPCHSCVASSSMCCMRFGGV
jgi:hypothetical protein